MSLSEQQNFLARLYTDPSLRRAFLREPQKIGKKYNLSDREIAELAAVLPDELIFFADSLVWKRLREVEKFLPLTKKVLAQNFEKFFREFSQTFNPRSIKKHFEDAVGFCEFLQEWEIEPVWAKDLAKFEQSRLLFNSNAKNFVFRKFDFDIREILKTAAKSEEKPRKAISKRKTFAVWVRIGNRTKQFIF